MTPQEAISAEWLTSYNEAGSRRSVLALRIADDPVILAQHYEDETFKLPITVMVLDQKNTTMWITICSSGITWH